MRAECTALLRCGTVLTYEAPGFLPTLGETIPCRRHGYCVVERLEGRGQPDGRRGRAHTRRTEEELLDRLRRQPATSVHALRRERFTLRVIAAVERNGLVSVDLETGTVALRSGPQSERRHEVVKVSLALPTAR